MAFHPIHPLLAVCDDSKNIYLHRINTDQPQLMHLPLIHLGQYDASCIAFHATLPLVAALWQHQVMKQGKLLFGIYKR